MRAVVTRVRSASVTIDGQIAGQIGKGYLVLLGISVSDTPAQAEKLANKVCNLVVSQFTLYADCKSRRPGFTGAARPETAIPLYEQFIGLCRDRGFPVETGRFGADMLVRSENDGPVTILMDTDAL